MSDDKHLLDHLKPRSVDTPGTDYFQSMAQKIYAEQKTTVVPIYRKPVFWWSSAAAAVVLAVLSQFFLKSAQNDPLLALNTLSQEEIYRYVQENIDDFDTDSIAAVLSDDALDASWQMIPFEPEDTTLPKNQLPSLEISLESLTEEDILNYLLEEGITPDELEEELTPDNE